MTLRNFVSKQQFKNRMLALIDDFNRTLAKQYR